MTDRQALLSAAGKQRPYKAVNIKPPAMPGDIYCMQESRGLVAKDIYVCIEHAGKDGSLCRRIWKRA